VRGGGRRNGRGPAREQGPELLGIVERADQCDVEPVAAADRCGCSERSASRSTRRRGSASPWQRRDHDHPRLGLPPGSAKPFPGVDAAVYDEEGNEVGRGGGGYLVLPPSVTGRRRRPRRPDHRAGDSCLRLAQGWRGGLARDARGASRARGEEDRQDRPAGEHRLHPRAAEDPLGEDP
jgi:hypothetical protein